MTIFDSIRFPNVDIYNAEDLQKLPQPILDQWAIAIYIDCFNLPPLATTFTHISGEYARSLAEYTAYSVITNVANNSTFTALMAIYKNKYTKILNTIIAEYETI